MKWRKNTDLEDDYANKSNMGNVPEIKKPNLFYHAKCNIGNLRCNNLF